MNFNQKTRVALAVASVLAILSTRRARTQDTSFGFRMPAGFAGDVNRTHPMDIVPGLMNTSIQTPRLFGDPVMIDPLTNSYRGIIAADTGPIAIDGLVVRPYPTQQTTGGLTSTVGVGAPAVNQPVDVLCEGYMICKVNTPSPVVTKKGPVYIWVAADSGLHKQGGLESAAAGSSTIQVSNAFFNGPTDASGVTEIVVQRASI